MKKYTLYVGLNDKDTKKQQISTLEAYKILQNLLLNNNVEGATIFEAKGIYKHENGEYVTENTLRVELMFIEKEILKNIVDNIKTILNQESVIVQFEEVNTEPW